MFLNFTGGQPADTGIITKGDAIFRVKDAKLQDRTTVLHSGNFEGEGKFNAGDQVHLKVDSDKRTLNAKLHSAGIFSPLSSLPPPFFFFSFSFFFGT